MQFNMTKIGQRISELRKAKNMTQMYLADQMGISYQAVSNWERGETMPDISKLPELATIFDCSIDDILGNSRASEVVEYVTRGNAPADAICGGEIVDLAPLLAPQTTESLVAQSGQGREVAAFDIQDLVELSPFVESRFLGEQLLKFPLEKVTSDILAQAAPFLHKEHIDLLVDRLLASDQAMCLDQLSTLAPFIGREKLNQLVDRFVESGQEVDLEYLCSLAPFVSQTKLDQLVEKFIASDQEVHLEFLPSLAPFVSQAKLNKLFNQAMAAEKMNEDILVSLAPFISQNILEQSILDHLDSLKSKRILVSLAPFIDPKILQFLLTHGSNEA